VGAEHALDLSLAFAHLVRSLVQRR
jgi:hypothetical protein